MFSERKKRKKAGRIAGSILLLGALLVPGTGRAQEPGGDGDRDGVTDFADACPTTPAGARPLSQGCSALELARHPEVFLGQVTAGLAERTAELPQDTVFAAAVSSLEAGRAGIDQAASELRRGEVCRADDTYALALQELGRGQEALAQATDAAAGSLLSQRTLTGDASEAETRTAFLRLAEGLAVRAVDGARAARSTVTAVCDSVAGGLSWSGKVTATQDAQGTITTANGTVALPAGSFRQMAYEGGNVTLSGITFTDGTGFATSWSGGVPGPGPGPSPGDCLALRIAPLQKFIFSNGPFTLHDPLAYTEANGALGLEAGMRLAVVDLGCSKGTVYSTYFYKAKIDADTPQGPVTVTVDLASGEVPVEIPATAQKITATFVRISCGFLGCATPETLGTKTWSTVVRPRASYAKAAYKSTAFGVTDNGASGDFEAGRVTILSLSPFVPAASSPAFSAQGYTITNGVSSRPQALKVQLNTDFAVYEDDFFDPDLLFSLEFTGVDHAAGLKWPKISGTRNGKIFWYSVQLPQIVRDRVTACEPAPHCFYKLPYTGGWPVWNMGKGNADDPINGHGGVQKFAFDFGAPEHTNILAARGGKVIWIVETETKNNMQDPTYTGIGNFMFIAHEDGTYGVYFHMPKNGVFVSVGDRVHRGGLVAEVGNTGNSGGPHLHFESGKQCPPQACPWLGAYDTVKIVFDTFLWESTVGGGAAWVHETCHLPRVGEMMFSTQ
ncbi:MAG TPA: M23 family metallopeptidase [Thermoanaerobaculia bacterium]|nr:M23 family metallopeptidase [Thermoanaerobaculia bacterium]